MSSFWKRAIFGALFVAVFISVLVLGNIHSMIFFTLTSVIGLYEIYKMENQFKSMIKGLLGVILFFIVANLGVSIWGVEYYDGNYDGMVADGSYLIGGALIYLLLIIQLFSKKQVLLKKSFFTLLLLGFYVLAPFLAINLLFFKFDPILLLGITIVIWANDTFAYLVGRKIGKTKLFERISPNKTWEGSLGGALIALIFVVLVNPYFFDELSRWDWFFVGLISIVFGSTGDLIESMFKRHYGVKDSGNVIPGHGGVLDRFDALMGAIPFVYVYLYFMV